MDLKHPVMFSLTLDEDEVIGIVSSVLYGGLGLFLVLSFFWSLLRGKEMPNTITSTLAENVRRVFRIFLTLFVLGIFEI